VKLTPRVSCLVFLTHGVDLAILQTPLNDVSKPFVQTVLIESDQCLFIFVL